MTCYLRKVSLGAICLLWAACGAKHSSVGPEKPNQLAGRPLLKWHYPAESAGVSRFAGAIFQDVSGRYWVGNGLGLASYDDKQGVWTTTRMETLKWRVVDIQQIVQSNDHVLWIRSTPVLSDNIRFYDGQRWNSALRFSESRVSLIIPGAAGNLWFVAGNELVTYNGGVWLRRAKISELIKNPRLQHISTISAGLEDRAGDVWLAMSDGIVRLDPLTNTVKNYFKQEHLTQVRCMYEGKLGSIWVGTYDGFVSVYQKDTESWHSQDLSKYLPSGRREERPVSLIKLVVNGFLQDSNGQMMIATARGLLTVDGTGDNWQPFTHENSPLPEGSITSIMQDRDGRIWLGTSEGILVLDKSL